VLQTIYCNGIEYRSIQENLLLIEKNW